MYGLLFRHSVSYSSIPIEEDVELHAPKVNSLEKEAASPVSVWIRAGSPKSQTDTTRGGPQYYKRDGPLRFSTATYDAVVPCSKEEGADLAV